MCTYSFRLQKYVYRKRRKQIFVKDCQEKISGCKYYTLKNKLLDYLIYLGNIRESNV